MNRASFRTVLVIDDESFIGATLSGSSTFKVSHCESIVQTMAEIKSNSFDAVVINLDSQPEERVADFFIELGRYQKMPCVLVTMTELLEGPVTHALKNGATDFVARSATQAELVARLNIRMRFSLKDEVAVSPGHEVLSVNQIDRKLYYRRRSIDMTLKQMKLIMLLLRSGNDFLPRNTIENELWTKVSVSPNSIDKKVSEVRQLMRELKAPYRISCVYGQGFKLLRIPD